MTRESICDETANAMRVGKFALIRPVSTSTLGRWVAAGALEQTELRLARPGPNRQAPTWALSQLGAFALGGTMIVLPIYLQMVFEYSAMQAGLSLAPLSLTMFGVALLAERKAGDRRASAIIRVGFALLTTGLVILIPIFLASVVLDRDQE